LCVECLKKEPPRVTEATELDHIIALDNGGADEEDNRQGLCGPCHRDKTTRDMGYRVRKVIGVDGYPVE
jgi:5-methylcytosine-specific restriction protein A